MAAFAQKFEESIFKDLYEAIITEFPEPPAPRSDLDFERAFHMHFVDDQSRYFIGRHVREAVVAVAAAWSCR